MKFQPKNRFIVAAPCDAPFEKPSMEIMTTPPCQFALVVGVAEGVTVAKAGDVIFFGGTSFHPIELDRKEAHVLVHESSVMGVVPAGHGATAKVKHFPAPSSVIVAGAPGIMQ